MPYDMQPLIAEGFYMKWRDMEDDPPPMDCEPVRVKTDSGFECAAEFFKWSCTGMCAPPGQRIHTPHMHSAWVMVDEMGDHLYEGGGSIAEVEPVTWSPMDEE